MIVRLHDILGTEYEEPLGTTYVLMSARGLPVDWSTVRFDIAGPEVNISFRVTADRMEFHHTTFAL